MNAEKPEVKEAAAAFELDQTALEVLRAIRSVRYGSVEITIHDSRVVQIERKEKRRFF